ncbi:hypothetical protein ACWGNM_34625 [Streptomyces sp. NPDC055796]
MNATVTFSHQRSAAAVRVGVLRARLAGVLGAVGPDGVPGGAPGVVPGAVPGPGAEDPGVDGARAGGAWVGEGGCVVPGAAAGDPPWAEAAEPLGIGAPGAVLPAGGGEPSPSCCSSTADPGGTLSPARRSGPGATAPAAA